MKIYLEYYFYCMGRQQKPVSEPQWGLLERKQHYSFSLERLFFLRTDDQRHCIEDPGA
jgi:hypothetical protein